jgi:hypothetical protein
MESFRRHPRSDCEETVMPTAPHRYCVHAAHDGPGAAHRVEGRSFEDAAMTFVEIWSPAPDTDGEVSVIVREAEGGREQCFRIDLSSGDAAPCD